jgi:hypothetical protein
MNFDVQYPDNGNEQKAVVTRVDGDPVLYVTSVLGSESLTTGRYKLYKADKQTSRLLTKDGRYTVQNWKMPYAGIAGSTTFHLPDINY